MIDPTIRDWLKALGVLVSGSLTAEEADMKLNAYAPMLAADLPSAAFSARSLNHVAKRCKWFPSYAELHEAVKEWWDVHKPQNAAIRGKLPVLSHEDQAWLNVWYKLEAQGWPPVPGRADAQSPEDVKALNVSMMRRYAPRAYAVLFPRG